MLYICFFFNDTATTEIYTYDTLFPYTTLFRSSRRHPRDLSGGGAVSRPVARRRRRAAPLRRRASADADRQGRAPAAPPRDDRDPDPAHRSEEHTSELQSLMRISYAVFCLQKKRNHAHHK